METNEDVCDEDERPPVNMELAGHILKTYYGISSMKIEELKSHEDRNFYISTNGKLDKGGQFVLKCVRCDLNEAVSSELETAIIVMERLKCHGFNVPEPMKGLNNQYIQNHLIKTGDNEDKKLNVILLTYLQGDDLINSAPLSSKTLFELGQLLYEVQSCLQSLNIAALGEARPDHEWMLENFTSLGKYSRYMNSPRKVMLITHVLQKFERDVFPQLHKFPRGVVHADFHDENLLLMTCTKEKLNSNPFASSVGNSYKLKYGILDFGDVCKSAYVFDLATSLAFFMIGAKVDDFIEYCRDFLSGYISQRPLEPLERDSLYVSVCASYCRELLLCEYHYKLQYEKNDYLLTSTATGWDQLEKLIELGKEEVTEMWYSAA